MRTTKDPESRRDDILRAALGIFREAGFDKTSVESITRAAGISKGSFYNYFESKEKVYEAVVSDIAMKTVEAAKEILTTPGISPKERLQKYIDWTFVLAQSREKSLSRVLSKEADENQRKIYMLVLDEGISQMQNIFEDLLHEGMDCKDFDLPDAAFATTFLMGAFRGVHVAFYNQLNIDMQTGKEYLYDLLSRLLRTNLEA
jgi:AcrR family transcriptional regulator